MSTWTAAKLESKNDANDPVRTKPKYRALLAWPHVFAHAHGTHTNNWGELHDFQT